jgi:hypothetical protein
MSWFARPPDVATRKAPGGKTRSQVFYAHFAFLLLLSHESRCFGGASTKMTELSVVSRPDYINVGRLGRIRNKRGSGLCRAVLASALAGGIWIKKGSSQFACRERLLPPALVISLA